MMSINLFTENEKELNISVVKMNGNDGQTYYNLRINEITIYDVNLIKDQLIAELNKIPGEECQTNN